MVVRNKLETPSPIPGVRVRAEAPVVPPRTPNVVSERSKPLRDRFSGSSPKTSAVLSGQGAGEVLTAAGAKPSNVARGAGLSIEQSLNKWKPTPSSPADPSTAARSAANPEGINVPNPGNEASRQQDAIAASIAQGGAPVPFINSDGVTENVVVEELQPSPFESPPVFGLPTPRPPTYGVQVGDSPSFTVTFHDESVDRESALATIVNGYSETPANLRGALNNVDIRAESKDNHIVEGAATAAEADTSAGNITFFDGDANINDSIFHHELAHLIGTEQPGGRGFWSPAGEATPEGWGDAAVRDGNFPSSYAQAGFDRNQSYTEDFAVSWEAYQKALDEGPQAVSRFQTDYPARFEILSRLQPAQS